MMGIIEPILAGLSISLINKYIINNDCVSNFVLSLIMNKSKRHISNSSSDLENIDYIRNNSVESYTTGIIDDINNHLIHSH